MTRLCGRVRSKFAAICAFFQREGNARSLMADATSCLVSSCTNNHGNPFSPTVGVPHTVNLTYAFTRRARPKLREKETKERERELSLPAGNLLQSKYLTQVSLENILPLFIAIKRILTDLAYQRQRIQPFLNFTKQITSFILSSDNPYIRSQGFLTVKRETFE